ncbi:hypothetical protein [Massilia soli]|uniref:Uncharacterized protein n=1 Tax=Massilia soli TaxID=2792854 RepID=A0ABS7SL68_9BURK|nr:hypothetical protein [Massilia soli]MBZ2206689.1 hypothetical protein [Massilia soli]
MTQVVADTTVQAGKTAAASVLACGSGLMGDVSWTQVSGPAITMLSAQSPTVSFDAAGPGVVKLRADVRLASGATESPTVDITVEPRGAGSFVTVRSDHSVRPGTDTSVRAWPTLAAGENLTRIVWTQVSGPTVEMNTSDERVLMFRAPTVASDTALKFRATMTTSLGRQDADDVIIAVERQTLAKDSLLDMTQRVHPYRSAARYAGVLKQCTYDVALYYTDSVRNNFCKASTLPLLQEEVGPGAVPTVAQVMGRVLVSHDFLGANFEQFLLTQDPHGDFRRMLAGTTAIVLGSHVRPSFYMSATGAIYLDANNLWLTAEQRDVVTEVPDYRLAFDDELNFSSFGRQVRGNDYARRALPSTERMTRSVDELLTGLGRLLYHELAHAADFFTPAQRTLDPSLSIWGNVVGRISGGTLVSDALSTRYPLSSVEMAGLGQVMFQGIKATEVQKAYSATDVGRFFGADLANDEYAYSTPREDLAMLFEEFMMVYRHGIRYDIAFTNALRDGMPSSQVLVAWGQRGRIAEAAIKPRIKLVLAQVAPWIDPAVVDTLPAAQLMRVGQTWDANLVLGGSSGLSGISASKIVSKQEAAQRLREDARKPRD